MSYIGHAYDQEQEADNGKPTRATGVPKIVPQRPTPSSGRAKSQFGDRLERSRTHPGNLNLTAGRVLFRELDHRAFNHAASDKSLPPLGPTDGDDGEPESTRHREKGNYQQEESLQIVPWIELTVGGVRSRTAEFMPLNHGFSRPSLNPFRVGCHSGVLDELPNQFIYFSPARPTARSKGRICPLCKYTDQNNNEVHILLPSTFHECPRCAFIPLMFTSEDLQGPILSPESSDIGGSRK